MAQADLIDEKAEIWLNKPDLELTDLDATKSIKTNHLISHRNFLNIKKWVNGLLAYIRYLRKLIDIDNIINEVFEKLRTQKLTFNINKSVLLEKNIDQQTSNGYTYKIELIDDNTVEITSINDSNFITDMMCVTVKTNDGIIVYPTIQTVGTSIKIYFPDGIYTNYQVYVI